MKKLFLLLVFMYGMSVLAQQAVVANVKGNLMYAGVDFPLRALIENYGCNTVKLTTNNGKIYGSGCNWVCRPNKAGLARIDIWRKKDNTFEKIGEQLFNVRILPPPVASLGAIYEDSVSKKVVIAMGGIRIGQWHWDFDAPLQIKRYTVLAFRNQKLLFWKDNIGAVYNIDTQVALQQLQANDILMFNNIQFEKPFIEMEKKVVPLQFIIKK